MFFWKKNETIIDLVNDDILFYFQMAATPITKEKVHKAKMSIENFYANLVNQYEEREER